MAATFSLYSRSPPTVFHGFSRHSNSSFGTPGNGEQENGAGSRTTYGGLSVLLAGSKPSTSCTADVVDYALGGASFLSQRTLAQTDTSLVAGPRECHESRSNPMNIPTSSVRLRDRSPVSVLLGSSSNRSSFVSPVSSLVTWDSSVQQSSDASFPSSKRRSLTTSKVDSFTSVPSKVGFRLGGDGDTSAFDFGTGRGTSWQKEGHYGSSFSQTGEAVSDASAFHSVADTHTCSRDKHAVGPGLSRYPLGSGALGLFDCDTRHDLISDPSWSFRDLYQEAVAQNEMFLKPLVKQAFEIAASAHHNQVRRNGEPYLVHCIETALTLAVTGLDEVVVAAGLLHDTLDDTDLTEEELRDLVGKEVADLVAGVSKMSTFSQLVRDNGGVVVAPEGEEGGEEGGLHADKLRNMFLAMVDVRVVLVKLADRLHNMRTLDALPPHKQQRVAKETLEVFAPLANRLGIWSWKAEMEDLCFKYLMPQEYAELAATVEAEGRGEDVVRGVLAKFERALEERGLDSYFLCGRPKNLYSIHLKMKNKGRAVHEIYDVRGLRLIVRDEESCYAALEEVQKLWKAVPGKYKDYIRKPKENGYQSLHAVVVGEDGYPLEVQIRTLEMHHRAEFGLAAHWRYKEDAGGAAVSEGGPGRRRPSYVEQRAEWARWVLTWHCEMKDTKIRMSSATEMDLRPPCPFPNHKEDCPYAMCCSALHPSDGDGDDDEANREPVMVLMLEDDKLLVREFPAGATAGTVVEDRRMRDIMLSSSSSSELSPCSSSSSTYRAMVNNERVYNEMQRLQMGDLVIVTEEEDEMEGYLPPLLPLHVEAEEDIAIVHPLPDISVEMERHRLVRCFSLSTPTVTAAGGAGALDDNGNIRSVGVPVASPSQTCHPVVQIC